MLTIGSQHLRKRYVYPNNVTSVYSGSTLIWPYIVDTTTSAWNLTLSVSPTSVAGTGGTVTITTSATRTITDTWVYYEGTTSTLHTESRTETGTVSLSSTVGTISGNTLTIPANNTGASRTITVTATSNGVTKTATITQATNVSYKYYAVTTDAYQVVANGITKTVPSAPSGSPTNSYHYGTVVFQIQDGPSTVTASFIGKDYVINTKGGIAKTSPVSTYSKTTDALMMRMLSIGMIYADKRLMTVPSDIVLTGYNTEADAINAASQALCTIKDSGYEPHASKTSLTIENATSTFISERIDDNVYYGVYDINLPEQTTAANVKITTTNADGNTEYDNIKRSASAALSNDMPNDRFGIYDISGHVFSVDSTVSDYIAFFTETPNTGLTVDAVAHKYLDNDFDYSKRSNFYAHSADGSEVLIEGGSSSYDTILLVYGWVSESSTWIKLGEITLFENTTQVFVYKYGVAGSLTRKLVYPSESEQVGEFSDLAAGYTNNPCLSELGFDENGIISYVTEASANIGSVTVGTNGNVTWNGDANTTGAEREIIITGTDGTHTGTWTFTHLTESATTQNYYVSFTQPDTIKIWGATVTDIPGIIWTANVTYKNDGNETAYTTGSGTMSRGQSEITFTVDTSEVSGGGFTYYTHTATPYPTHGALHEYNCSTSM